MNQENLKKGYILLFRSLLDNKLYKERREFSKFEAWVDILFSVNHSDSSCLIGNTVFECKRGQCLYSLETWLKRWFWKSKYKVREFLLLLESQDMIAYENVGKTIKITVLNYESYQDFRGENSDSGKTSFVQDSNELRESFRKDSVQKQTHLNTSISDTYKDSQNASKTQAKREKNASKTQAKREKNQVINVINLSNSINENVCESHTQEIKILENEIQQLRSDWGRVRNEMGEVSVLCNKSELRLLELEKGHEVNQMDKNEWFAVLEVATMHHNSNVGKYNALQTQLNELTGQGNYLQKEKKALESKGQYGLFSESVFTDKSFFVQKLFVKLQSENIKVSKHDLEEYYERAKSYSQSKQMKSADWVSEVSGWVRKDKVKLRKAV